MLWMMYVVLQKTWKGTPPYGVLRKVMQALTQRVVNTHLACHYCVVTSILTDAC